MKDLISRAAAIDALIRKMRPHDNGDGTITIYIMSEELVRETLNDLPSAQPEFDFEKVNDAHNEGYDVGYWAGRRDYEQQWIPCNERLPEKEGIYIVTDDAGGIATVSTDEFSHYESGEPMWMFSQNVTAWMPLPEPYEERREE